MIKVRFKRAIKWGRKGRERERIPIRTQCRAQRGALRINGEVMTWAEIKELDILRQSRPGTPEQNGYLNPNLFPRNAAGHECEVAFDGFWWAGKKGVNGSGKKSDLLGGGLLSSLWWFKSSGQKGFLKNPTLRLTYLKPWYLTWLHSVFH